MSLEMFPAKVVIRPDQIEGIAFQLDTIDALRAYTGESHTVYVRDAKQLFVRTNALLDNGVTHVVDAKGRSWAVYEWEREKKAHIPPVANWVEILRSLVQIASGEITVELGSGTYTVSAREDILLPEGVTLMLRGQGNETVITSVNGGWLRFYGGDAVTFVDAYPFTSTPEGVKGVVIAKKNEDWFDWRGTPEKVQDVNYFDGVSLEAPPLYGGWDSAQTLSIEVHPQGGTLILSRLSLYGSDTSPSVLGAVGVDVYAYHIAINAQQMTNLNHVVVWANMCRNFVIDGLQGTRIRNTTSTYAYLVLAEMCLNVRIENFRISKANASQTGWGAFATHYCRRVTLRNGRGMRYDAHKPFYDYYLVENVILDDFYMGVSGLGTFILRNVRFEILDGLTFSIVQLRDDAPFLKEAVVENVEVVVRNAPSSQIVYIFGSWANSYPTLKIGSEIQRITVRNLTIEGGQRVGIARFPSGRVKGSVILSGVDTGGVDLTPGFTGYVPAEAVEVNGLRAAGVTIKGNENTQTIVVRNARVLNNLNLGVSSRTLIENSNIGGSLTFDATQAVKVLTNATAVYAINGATITSIPT